MSKRKLNRHQAWRIEKIQEGRRKRAEKRDASTEAAVVSGELGGEQAGLVTAHYGTQIEVEGGDGQRQRCHMRANLDGLVTGDQVIWCSGDPIGVVVAQVPRDSELLRPDPYGKLKPVAANIDQIIVVIAPLPEPHAHLIDRYLVAAEVMGITPLILLNKSDWVSVDNRPHIEQLLSPYSQLGYQVLEASCKQARGLDELLAALSDKVSVFVGQSGVGKSSLVNMLLPQANARVGELSETSHKGTHTTTTAELFHLVASGSLIDSPGIREFGLWHMDRDQVESGFREFSALSGQCKFRDCKHEQELGCALLKGVESGEVSERRLRSYRYIVSTL